MTTITFTFTVSSGAGTPPLTASLILGSPSAALSVREGFAALLGVAPGAVLIVSITDTATGQLTALGAGSTLNGARWLQPGPAGVAFLLQAAVHADAASVATATALLASPAAVSGAVSGSILTGIAAALGRDAASLSGAVSPSSIAVTGGIGAAAGSAATAPSIVPIAAGAGGGVLLLAVAAAWFACRRSPEKAVAAAEPVEVVAVTSRARGRARTVAKSTTAAAPPDAAFEISNPVVKPAAASMANTAQSPLTPPLAPTHVGLISAAERAKVHFSAVPPQSAGPPQAPQRLSMARRSDGTVDYDELDRDELLQLAAERGISINGLKVRDIRSKLAASDEAAAAVAVLAASPPTRKASLRPPAVAPPPPPPAAGAGLMLRAPAPLAPLRSRVVVKAAKAAEPSS